MASKKHLIKTINFGEVGSPARIIVEAYVKQHGGESLSKLMRKLVVIYLSDSEEYRDWKVQRLKYERREAGEEIFRVANERKLIESKLENLGYKLED